MSFIKKTSVSADLKLLLDDYYNVVNKIGWPRKADENDKTLSTNQIGLNHRPNANDPWLDNVGSLFDINTRTFVAQETDFTVLNKDLGSYTKEFLNKLALEEGITLGRVRYMRLPEKSGLTVHQDLEQRYHVALETNPNAFFGEVIENEDFAAKCHNIPADGSVYKVDTTLPHFVYNGSRKDRIHLVICTESTINPLDHLD